MIEKLTTMKGIKGGVTEDRPIILYKWTFLWQIDDCSVGTNSLLQYIFSNKEKAKSKEKKQ